MVNLPAGEIIPSLRSGAIDASEFAGPWVDMALGLHKAAKYYYYPGFHEPGAAISLVVNKKLWDGLGSTERNIIETAAAAENANSFAEFTANDAIALQQLANELRKDERLRLCSDQAVATTRILVDDCKKIFSELNEALK